MTPLRTLLALTLLLPAACSVEASPPDSGLGGDSCGTPVLDPSAPLWGEVCPPTWQAALAVEVTCSPPTWTYMRYVECPSDNLLRMSKSWGTHGYDCFYDGTNQQVVGTGMFDDVPTFCNRSSYAVRNGRTSPCPDEQLLYEGELCAAIDGGVDGTAIAVDAGSVVMP